MSSLLTYLLLGLVPCLVLSQQCTPPPSCSSTSAVYDFIQSKPTSQAAIFLVGLFGIHDPGQTALQCGDIKDSGIQNAEAFKFAVQTFQARYPTVMSDVNIGGLIFDSCGSSLSLTQDILNLEGCAIGYGDPDPVKPGSVIGYVGLDSGSEVKTVAPIVAQLEKTVITSAAAGIDLNNPSKYPTLLRTVPSSGEQVHAMVALLSNMNWKYVQAVYSDDAFGMSVLSAFKVAAEKQNICIVNSVSVSDDASDDDYIEVVNSLLTRTATRPVFVFAPNTHARNLLRAVNRNSAARGRFTWMGISSWSDSPDLVAEVEPAALGAITLALEAESPAQQPVEEYIKNLKPENANSPWFNEYWEKQFSCRLPDSKAPFVSECDTSSQSLADLRIDNFVPYTIAAVDSLLFGFEDARKIECGGTTAVCNSFLNDANKWALVHDKVRAVQVDGKPVFNSTSGQAARAKHVIYNYRELSPGQYGYTKIGTYDGANKKLFLSAEPWAYDSAGDIVQGPSSWCGGVDGVCAVCGETTSTSTTNSPTTSANPNNGDGNAGNAGSGEMGAATDGEDEQGGSGIRREKWIIALIVLASLGILLVFVLEIYLMSKMMGRVFMEHARTMWLGQLLLLAILLCYLVLFAFVPKPSVASCTIIRFGVGVTYAMCFSVLLVKLMILLSSKTLGYLQGVFQVLMFLFAWVVQIAVDSQWIVLQPAEVIAINTTDGMEYMCATDFTEHVKSLIYIMFLIVICVLLAVKAHGIVTNHREGIYIGVSVGFSIPIWLAWILLGMLSDNTDFHEPCLAFGLFLTATLILLVMFLPKVRQLNTMGHEGIYAEDTPEYGGSLVAPSVVPPGSVVGTNNFAYVSSPSPKSQPTFVIDGPRENGDIVDGGGFYSAPSVVTKVQYDHNASSLYLKHPGAPQTTLRPPGGGHGGGSASVHSMPISRSSNMYYSLPRPRKDGIQATTTVLRPHHNNGPATGSAASQLRNARSEQNLYGTMRSNRSARSYRSGPGSVHSQGSHTSTLKQPKSFLDLGSL